MIEIFVDLRFFPKPERIGEAIARWDALGVDGVTLGDHIFPPMAPYRAPEARRGMDELTMLTVIATLSERLKVAGTASNVGFQHPLLLIRKYAQLAVLYGGERVYAGFGAGWARREFEAIGLPMPPHARRLDRLEETLRLARQLFDVGYADLDGEHVKACELPLSPAARESPEGARRRRLNAPDRDGGSLCGPHRFQCPFTPCVQGRAAAQADDDGG